MESENCDILIIGGGPAGMFSAIAAAAEAPDLRIVLIDANMKLGRKIGVTGNGRCNLTNAEVSSEKYHGGNPRFVNGVLGKFGNAELLQWFNDLGVEFKLEENGKYYPVTDQAVTIVDNLKEALEAAKIEIILNTRIKKIERENGLFSVTGPENKRWFSRTVVVATGGLTYPQLGATADGYEFARQAGHEIAEPRPSLTGFETHDKSLFDLQGVQAMTEATLVLDGEKVKTVTGEVMFTHYGISGPAIFDLSPDAVRADLAKVQAVVSLNFFPGLSYEAVEQKILAIWEANPSRLVANTLIGILPKKLCQVIMRNKAGIDISLPASNVTKKARQDLVKALTDLEIRLKKPCDFKEAQVTAGGVKTDAVDPKTMESKLWPGLFFVGEVLDIDGDCGGFNLQFAFSSGRAAGISASVRAGK